MFKKIVDFFLICSSWSSIWGSWRLGSPVVWAKRLQIGAPSTGHQLQGDRYRLEPSNYLTRANAMELLQFLRRPAAEDRCFLRMSGIPWNFATQNCFLKFLLMIRRFHNICLGCFQTGCALLQTITVFFSLKHIFSPQKQFSLSLLKLLSHYSPRDWKTGGTWHQPPSLPTLSPGSCQQGVTHNNSGSVR